MTEARKRLLYWEDKAMYYQRLADQAIGCANTSSGVEADRQIAIAQVRAQQAKVASGGMRAWVSLVALETSEPEPVTST